MCIVIKKKDFELKTAKKDIIVYKKIRLIKQNGRYLKNKVTAYYMFDYIYKKDNKQPVIDLRMTDCIEFYAINEGYHFYRKIAIEDAEFAMLDNKNINKNKNINIIHRYAQFTIPKDTKYCVKKYSNLGVAGGIIFNKILDIDDLKQLLKIGK